MEDFNKFRKQMLVSTKAGADLLSWFAIGFFVSFLYKFVNARKCPFPVSRDEFGIQDACFAICEGGYSYQLSAMAWVGFSILRIFFLASPWQAGPILKLCGLKIEGRDKKTVTLGFAARYALLEWLPFHILSLYVLLFGMPANLYAMGSVTAFVIAAQLFWLAPVILKYHGLNISQFLTGGDVAFDAAKAKKIETIYQGEWKTKFKRAAFYIGNFVYVIITVFFTFVSFQVLRVPNINPEYERLLYANREPVWENNIYFAMEGLTAPANVTDTYAYGHARGLQRFKDYEVLKKLAHIPYAYEIPKDTNLPAIHEDQELKFNSEGWKDLSCLFSMSPPSGDLCATKQDFQSYIQANQTIWDRFNALPDYSLYRVPPQQLGGKSINYINLENLKAAQIIDIAENGDPEKAFQEWDKYMKLYRSMAGAQETMLFKARISIAILRHLSAFEKLLYLHPELAKSHAAEISVDLKPDGDDLFRTAHMLSDDIGVIEPILLGSFGNVNAIRNDLYDCILSFQKLANLPAHQFFYGQKEKLCRLDDTSSVEGDIAYAFAQPGYFITNIMQTLLVGGTLTGRELVGSMKSFDIRLRMTSLAVEILKQDVSKENIPDFLSSAPVELQNPITQKPFEWDANTQSLFFVRPGTDTKVEFRLNLQAN